MLAQIKFAVIVVVLISLLQRIVMTSVHVQMQSGSVTDEAVLPRCRRLEALVDEASHVANGVVALVEIHVVFDLLDCLVCE